MQNIDSDFRTAWDSKGIEYAITNEFLYTFEKDGSVSFFGINEPQSQDCLTKSVAKIDVDGGSIANHSLTSSGIEFELLKDTVEGYKEEKVELFFPFAIHRGRGAFALNVMQL